MKYVPVLRYRREERGALKTLDISTNTIPLIEIMKERAGQYKKGSFEETYLRDFEKYNYPFIVDFPIYFHVTNSTTQNIREFLRKLKQRPSERLDYFIKLSSNTNIIPSISYNIEDSYIRGSYVSDATVLKNHFNRLAFRVFETPDFEYVIKDIEKIIRSKDILIYDIDDAAHTQNFLMDRYERINKLKKKVGCNTVLIRSAIGKSIVFNRLQDNRPVLNVDNSLLKEYSKYGFDAFGDFAGIRKDVTITEGGPEEPSPGFLFYSWHENSYIGYKGRKADWAEFINHIKPTVIYSDYWEQYSENHHEECPGCMNILGDPGKSAGNWKRYSIQHYIYTIQEFLL